MFCADKREKKNLINVLHNPGASLSSQDPPHWSVIDAPQDVMSYRTDVAFAPLNLTEIAILGGERENDNRGGFGENR